MGHDTHCKLVARQRILTGCSQESGVLERKKFLAPIGPLIGGGELHRDCGSLKRGTRMATSCPAWKSKLLRLHFLATATTSNMVSFSRPAEASLKRVYLLQASI